MHAQMWAERLRSSAEAGRFEAAVAELWPYALGLLEPGQRERLGELVGLDPVEPVERGAHAEGFAALHEEMTMVRRSVPGAAW